jgi:hypothetical protein
MCRVGEYVSSVEDVTQERACIRLRDLSLNEGGVVAFGVWEF